MAVLSTHALQWAGEEEAGADAQDVRLSYDNEPFCSWREMAATIKRDE